MTAQTFWIIRWWSASLNTSGTNLVDTYSLGISSSTSSFWHFWQHLVLLSWALWRRHVSTSYTQCTSLAYMFFYHILQVLMLPMDHSMGQCQIIVKVGLLQNYSRILFSTIISVHPIQVYQFMSTDSSMLVLQLPFWLHWCGWQSRYSNSTSTHWNTCRTGSTGLRFHFICSP